ncbi:hypothetical protein [Edaphobacter sp. DSM 109919]|uniref:Uncharacterized protein n=1 Tax=Edaphobacter paludis TaxID=3035702 RepID=A0AAU7CUP2_9BACT
MMQHSILKDSHLVTINYTGGSSDSLHAAKFTVDANDSTALLAFDLSYNQRRGKQTDNYTDVTYLLEHLAKVHIIQMNIDKVSKELRKYDDRYPNAKWTLEMVFADGVKHHFPGKLNAGFNSFTVAAQDGAIPTS